MQIVAIVATPDHVCSRYRLQAFVPELQSVGHTLQIVSVPRSWREWFRLRSTLDQADLVVVQRLLLSSVELIFLRQRVRHLAFDFDDAVWLRDSYHAKGFVSQKRANRFRAMIRRCDRVFAGNDYLVQEAQKWAKTPQSVHLIPTCVDPESYPIAQHGPGPVTLVWVGSSSTLQGLEKFRPTLERIGQQVPNVRLRIVCDRFLQFDHLPVEPVVWSQSSESSAIASAQIGIGWVPDDPWSRGKCALKILQYQAAALPVIANAVGVQSKFVQNDRTGFLANSETEWVDAVHNLAMNPELRIRLGLQARANVLQSYSVAAGAKLWSEALLGLTGVAPC